MAESADTSSWKDAVSPNSRRNSPTKRQAQPHESAHSQRKLEDDDLALARILQEQERAFYLLQGGVQGYEQQYEAGSVDEAGSVQGGGEEGATDEAPIDDAEFARRLQQQEQMDAFRRMYAAQGIDMEHLDQEVEEANVEGLGYEDLSTLGELAGHVSKGLPADDIARLPSAPYEQLQQEGHVCDADKCCICQLEYDSGDMLTRLPCTHMHHTECLATWLGINKVCPVCHTELLPKSADATADADGHTTQ